MPQPGTSSERLPGWIVFVGSVAIALHLVAVATAVLATPSGPWPTNFGTSMAEEPRFAQAINAPLTRYYLRPLHLNHNYHFNSNRNDVSIVEFEVKLRDRDGNMLKTVKFPEADANPWNRERQKHLALGLGDDQPVQPPRGEAIPAPGGKVKMVTMWEGTQNDPTLRVKEVPEHLVPRDHPVFAPSDWARLLARAYARYLGRQYGAASAEIVRRSREPIMPAAMFSSPQTMDSFDELVSTFGVQRLEN